jgi:exopolyphosphatase/guanosine-5'-triphosphate,3'-diphosphate pyrophosphatase
VIRSSIDLGTNTCLLLIADVEQEGGRSVIRREIGDYAIVVRLGEGVDQNRSLKDTAMQRTLDCLKGYSEKVKAAGAHPGDTVCVATSQARDAKNGAEFFSRVEKETGFRFRVISGDEEAQLTFQGALLPDLKPETSAVIDIGGGSTELIAKSGGQSVDIGSVRFTERFLKSDPVQDGEFWACQDAVDSNLETLKAWRKGLPQGTELVAVAGTATTLGAWYLGMTKFNPSELNSLTLTRGDIHRLVEELKWRTVEERCKLPGLEPKRADVLLAGAMILWRAMELLEFPHCRVSTRGLRYGALLDQSLHQS